MGYGNNNNRGGSPYGSGSSPYGGGSAPYGGGGAQYGGGSSPYGSQTPNRKGGGSPYSPFGSPQPKEERFLESEGYEKFDFFMLIFSTLAGLAGAAVSYWIYSNFIMDWYRPLLIGTVCAVFFAVYALIMILFTLIRGRFPASHNMVKRTIIPYILFLVGIFGAGVGFEYLYELEPTTFGGKGSSASSYIFVIDNSTSMKRSDGNMYRYDAMDKIVAGLSDRTPYAVYTFGSRVSYVRPLATKSSGEAFNGRTLQLESTTHFYEAIAKLADDFDNGTLSAAGKTPKVLFISDGEPMDKSQFGGKFDNAMQRLANRGVVICTIGLGEPNEELLAEIANRTNGTFVMVDNVDQLELTMIQAIDTDENRDILTYREIKDMDWLYFIERVVFMGIIGFAIGLSMLLMLAIDRYDLTNRVSMLKGAFGGLIVELMYRYLNVEHRIIYLIYFMMIAIIFGKYMAKPKSSEAPQVQQNPAPGPNIGTFGQQPKNQGMRRF